MFPAQKSDLTNIFLDYNHYNGELKFGPMNGIKFYHEYRKIEKRVTYDASWSICYKREFLNKNKLRFVGGIVCLQDGEFLSRVFCLAQICSYIDYSFYVHRVNPNSVTNSSMVYSYKALEGYIKAAINLKNFKKDIILTAKQKDFINQPLIKFVIINMQRCVTQRGIDFKKFNYVRKKLKEKGLSKIDLKGCNTDYSKFGRIYNFSIWLFLFYCFSQNLLISIKTKLRFT